MDLTPPVLFLVFNRLDTTARVFAAIRAARPARLYVAADGPRSDRPGEAERCAEARCIATAVDWPCDLRTLFRDTNLGCRRAVSGAITWFFEHEPEGIILEDDCLPHPTFFPYCAELLARYRDEPRIFLISGHNKAGWWDLAGQDYFFSNLGGIWGWASWARAWRHFDMNYTGLREFSATGGFTRLLGPMAGPLRERAILKARTMDTTWGFAWGFSRHKHAALACVPCGNLIRNIGFGLDATHTRHSHYKSPDMFPCHLPLRDNSKWIPDTVYDEFFLGARRLPVRRRVIRKLKSFLGKESYVSNSNLCP